MNIADEYHPDALSNLREIGQGWLRFCCEKPYNPVAPMSAAWHLAVTLQSNNPNVEFKRMEAALADWIWQINRETLGKRSTQKRGKQWCGLATYEVGLNDDQNTPHWHLIMTTGHDVKPEKARELLAEVRTDRRIGKHIVRGCRRVPLIETMFAAKWRRLMPKGSVKVDALYHPSDEEGWIRYILKHLTGVRFSNPADMKLAQDRIRVFGEWRNDPSKLH